MLVVLLPSSAAPGKGLPHSRRSVSASWHWGQCGMLVTAVGDEAGPLGPNPNSGFPAV